MSKFIRRYASVPNRAGRFTELRIYAPPVTFAFRIEGRLPARHRRALALALYRAIKPVIRHVDGGMIHHFGEGHLLNLWKDSNRELSMAQALETRSPNGKIGFAIRMWRLNAGLTQKQLARQVGMNRCHLSQVEHGRVLPKKTTLLKIERRMKLHLSPPPSARDERARLGDEDVQPTSG